MKRGTWHQYREHNPIREESVAMVGNYPVITLCGSTRFKDEFMEAQKQLTLADWVPVTFMELLSQVTFF